MTDAERAAEAETVEMETVGVDEIVRQERVRSIFDAKRDCRETRTKATNSAAAGDVNAGSIIFRNALETYIREVEPLFAQTEQGRRYWSDRDFGVVDVRPRHDEVDADNGGGNGRVPEENLDSDKQAKIDLRGLGSLFEHDTPVTVSWSVRTIDTSRMTNRTTVASTTVRRNIPMRALDRMYSVVNGYLAEIGFGVEVNQAQKNTKLDDDLLDEVADWRDENL